MSSSLRWRVAIVDDHERSRAALRAAIWSAGGEVIGEATRCADAVVKIKGWSPDIAVVAVGLPDGDGTEPAAELAAAAHCAIVLFTSHTEARVVRRAADAGVMAYLLKPLRPEEVAPTLDIALARFREVQALRRALEERKLIERAKGTLMDRYRLTEDEAFRRMRRAAMDSRRPMVDVARAVLVSESVAGTGPDG
ncbi:MAG: ANTAR domain-containing protein [Candidatus Rokubacteria bacterium]|nr:ANTAR domain-containing protein [Candidatus Rokubacteria bacterium]